MCHDAAEAMVAPAWSWIGERFDDDGESGSTRDRPALNRLMRQVECRQVDHVFVYRLDRVARNLHDSLHILDAFREHGVELHIITAPGLGSAATDRFLLNLMGSFAEFERDMIRSRLADSRAARKRHGLRLSGPPPYGYDVDAETKQLIPNKVEMQRTKLIFKHAAAGMSPSGIASLINEKGWRTTKRKSKRNGAVRGGARWTSRQILDMLQNPVYIGCFRDDDGLRPGKHKAAISQSQFDKVKELIADRRTAKRNRRSPKREAYPLRGKILCPRCLRIMSPHQSQGKNVIYRHYRCRSHAGGRAPCKGEAIPTKITKIPPPALS